MKEQIKVTMDIKIPRVPSYLFYGIRNKCSVGDLDVDSLKKVGKAWTESLIERATEMRKTKTGVTNETDSAATTTNA